MHSYAVQVEMAHLFFQKIMSTILVFCLGVAVYVDFMVYRENATTQYVTDCLHSYVATIAIVFFFLHWIKADTKLQNGISYNAF